MVQGNDTAVSVLELIKDIPGAWLGAGMIFQNIWNTFHGYKQNTHVKDIDILYWDAEDLSWDAENAYLQKLNQDLSELVIPIDIKNIARVHLWYEKRFGITKKPYLNVQESVATWPVIGACLAMRLNENTIEFCAPYGFQDALCMTARPNKILVSREVYQEKVKRWQQQWPLLTVLDW